MAGDQSKLPLPTVSKLLKVLLQSGFLISHRGNRGGYSLARSAQDISVAEMISALEGPIGLTECTTDVTGICDLEPSCPIKMNQRMISQVVRGALEKLTLADLIHPLQLIAIRDERGKTRPWHQPNFREHSMSTNLDTIRDLAQQEYKWGFITDIEEERIPKGLSEDVIRLISSKKQEPEFMLDWRLKAYRHWAALEKAEAEPKWANVHYPRDRLPEHRLLLGAQAEGEAGKSGPAGSGNSAHLRKAGNSAAGAEDARRSCRGRGV